MAFSIGFDIDGVLADFIAGVDKLAIEHSQKLCGTYTKRNNYCKDSTDWHLQKWFKDDWRHIYEDDVNCLLDIIFAKELNEEFWYEIIPPLIDDEGRSFLHYIVTSTRTNVYFVTFRPDKKVTEDWLKKYFNLSSPTVILSKYKSRIIKGIGIPIFFEDNAENILMINNKCPSCSLFVPEYPSNRDALRSLPFNKKSYNDFKETIPFLEKFVRL